MLDTSAVCPFLRLDIACCLRVKQVGEGRLAVGRWATAISARGYVFRAKPVSIKAACCRAPNPLISLPQGLDTRALRNQCLVSFL